MNSTNIPTIDINKYSLHTPTALILNSISLKFEGHGMVAIVGPSGHGKSTLAHSVARMLNDYTKWTATGDILMSDRSLSQWDERSLRSRIGFVMQQPAMLPHTVADNIVTPQTLINNTDVATAHRCASVLMYALGLSHHTLATRAHKLSGGEQQRLAIARAVLLSPPVLILDEPTSALDPLATATLIQYLKDLTKRSRVIMITHDIESARSCERVVFLRCGESQGATITADGSPEEVFDDPSKPFEFQFARRLPMHH